MNPFGVQLKAQRHGEGDWMKQPAMSGEARCIGRRALLAALGAGAMAATAGACSTDANADGAAPDAASTSASSVARRRVLTSTAAVPLGGGKLISGVLIVQPVAGQFKAFDARCPHQGARISPPEAGVITCYEHGSTFRDVDGAFLKGPAVRGLTEIPITVDNTTIALT